MLENNDLNFKQLLILCLFLTSFISLDVTFQAITGKNFFGLEGFERHNSSIFGKELIAGSYIQRFFLFAFVSLLFLFHKLDNKKLIIVSLLLSLFFSGILLSGNRMPVVMFVFSLGLMIILIKKLRKTLIIASVFSSLLFSSSLFINENLKIHYESFYENSIVMFSNIKNFSMKKYPDLENQKDKKNFVGEYTQGKNSKKLQAEYEVLPIGSGHHAVFLTAIDTWNDNIFWGSGLKSFRVTCKTKLHLPNRVCQSHPHNYYLELLNDTGLIGTFIFILSVLFLFISKITNFRNLKPNEKVFLICILIAITVELFPVRSTGSFFSTSNSSFIFFLLGLLGGFKNIRKKT